MTFRFIHTADLHLDSPLKTLALRDAELSSVIANATRQAFVRIVDACLSETVDALIIAGDLYDGEIRDMATPLFLGVQFKRLHDANIPVFIVQGNHDAASIVTRQLSLPSNVIVFSTGGNYEPIDTKGVVIHGVSFPTGKVSSSLIPRFKPPVQGLINIGILHTSLVSSEGHDVYAPCAVNDLIRQDYTYWALGHIHKRQVHSTVPAIVMPGIPQGRDINESGPKSATLVTINDNGLVELEEIHTSLAQFERVNVDLTDCHDMYMVTDRMKTALSLERHRVNADMLIARLHLSGITPMAGRLRRDADLLRAEAVQAAMRVGKTLIDAVECRTVDVTTICAEGVDPISDIRRLLTGNDDAITKLTPRAVTLIKELSATLPPELRDYFGCDESEIGALAQNLILEGSEDILAQLSSGNDT